MKEEAMKSHAEAVLAADGALYDAGYADGVVDGKKEVGGFKQEDIEAAEKKGYEAGYGQAQADDKTPISQEAYDSLKALYDADELTIGKAKELFGIVAAPKPVDPAPIDEGTVGTNAEA